MNSTHVFKQLNQDISMVFDRAGQPSKVACVILDYAKLTHKALICDASGRTLKNPFDVENSSAGLDFLCMQIHRSCKRFGIHPSNVVVGGEDCGSFSLNFVAALSRRSFLVIGVHPKAAHEMRENMQASTDKLDLLGIARLIIDRRGTTRSAPPGNVDKLRLLTRHRAVLVTTQTALRNHIHSIVDQIFPGFLDEKKSGISSFSKASCTLMKHKFSPAHIRRRSRRVLVRQLESQGVRESEKKAAQLQELAANVLQCPDQLVATLQTTLANEIRLYEDLLICIDNVDREEAKRLATTPGAMLTTVKGTGITLAAGVSAELSELSTQTSLRRLTSYAGIVPRIKQSGGPDKEARHGKVAPRCNRILKNYLVQSGSHMGLHGPEDLLADYARREAQGQHADFGMARRYLRMAMRLMRDNQAYLPDHLQRDTEWVDLRDYYLELWPHLRKKWKRAGALDEAFAPENPLGIWRNAIQEIYDIKLTL